MHSHNPALINLVEFGVNSANVKYLCRTFFMSINLVRCYFITNQEPYASPHSYRIIGNCDNNWFTLWKYDGCWCGRERSEKKICVHLYINIEILPSLDAACLYIIHSRPVQPTEMWMKKKTLFIYTIFGSFHGFEWR